MTKEEKKEWIKEYLRRRRQRLKKAKLCQDCGNAFARPGRTLCFFCLESRRIHEKNRQQRLQPQVPTCGNHIDVAQN